jgi:hypothetical protein
MRSDLSARLHPRWAADTRLRQRARLDPARGLDRADQIEELVASATVAPGELDKVAHAGVELALLRRRDDRDAPTAPDLEQPLVPKLPERTEDGVSVHLQHGGQVERGREPLAREGLSIRDRTANLGRNLLVQVCRLVSVQLDMKHLY